MAQKIETIAGRKVRVIPTRDEDFTRWTIKDFETGIILAAECLDIDEARRDAELALKNYQWREDLEDFV